ncbi:unnamed protein product [Lota lota]
MERHMVLGLPVALGFSSGEGSVLRWLRVGEATATGREFVGQKLYGLYTGQHAMTVCSSTLNWPVMPTLLSLTSMSKLSVSASFICSSGYDIDKVADTGRYWRLPSWFRKEGGTTGTRSREEGAAMEGVERGN